MYGSDPKTTPHFTACQKYGMLVLRPVDTIQHVENAIDIL